MTLEVRVMLSHVRLIQQSCVQPESHPLCSVFKLFGTSSTGDADPRKARRQQRLASKPNPFMHFRVAEPDAEADSEPEVSIITKWYDGKAARMLFSDGTESIADKYVEGALGFVEAVWLSPPATFVLDIANWRLNEDGNIQDARPPAPAKRLPKPKKRRLGKKTVVVVTKEEPEESIKKKPAAAATKAVEKHLAQVAGKTKPKH